MTMRRPLGLAALASCLGALLAGPASAAPAWWKVSNGSATLWIIGTPRVSPKDMTWDEAGLTQRLTGANQLVVSPEPRNGLKAMAAAMGSASGGAPLDQTLPPPLKRRFDEMSAKIGKDPKHYGNVKAAVAGVMMAGDAYKAWDLRPGAVEASVRKTAKTLGVREAPAGSFDVAQMTTAALNAPPAGQATCLGATLAGLEVGPQHMRAAAADWAKGNPGPASQRTNEDVACLAAIPQIKTLNDQNMAADTAAVAAALNAPGKSVAVFDLLILTTPGGVFDRLRQKGLTVSGPITP